MTSHCSSASYYKFVIPLIKCVSKETISAYDNNLYPVAFMLLERKASRQICIQIQEVLRLSWSMVANLWEDFISSKKWHIYQFYFKNGSLWLQITVGRRPVTGLRLCLEGSKQNRLSILVQHLVSLPKILHPYWDNHVAIGAPKWQGPEEQDSRWFEPVKWKNFSHVSTAPIENPETFIGDFSGVHIVTGAQLGVWDFGSRNVLYMKLLYSRLPGCTIRRSLWDHAGNSSSKTVNVGNTSNSDNSTLGENATGNKLVKYVDMSAMTKEPQDPPGHWLVTGGKLGVEKGKIVLRVKYSLLNYWLQWWPV